MSLVESSLAAGFYAGDLTCTSTTAAGAEAVLTGPADDGGPTAVDTQVTAGDTLACRQENVAAGSMSGHLTGVLTCDVVLTTPCRRRSR